MASRCRDSGSAAPAPAGLEGTVAGNTWMPAPVIRKVWIPGLLAWPRSLSTWSLRTMALRYTLWLSASRPSAMDEMGGGSRSDDHSPSRKEVIRQLLRRTPSCWMNWCASSAWAEGAPGSGRMDRNESMNTSAGELSATACMMPASTWSNRPVAASSPRFT